MIKEKKETEVCVGLVRGRHILPVDEYIYEEVLNVLDFEGIREAVSVTVYVTGFTACTAAVVAECMSRGISLTLMHFDRVSGTYVPQTL